MIRTWVMDVLRNWIPICPNLLIVSCHRTTSTSILKFQQTKNFLSYLFVVYYKQSSHYQCWCILFPPLYSFQRPVKLYVYMIKYNKMKVCMFHEKIFLGNYLKYLPSPVLECLISSKIPHVEKTFNKLWSEQVMGIIHLYIHIHWFLSICTLKLIIPLYPFVIIFIQVDNYHNYLNIEVSNFWSEERGLNCIRLITRLNNFIS